MKRCVLFDLDGTLIDTLNLYIQAMKRTLMAEVGDEVSMEELSSLRLNSEPRLLRYFIPHDEVGGAHRRFLANYHALHETCFGGVYPGVQDLLKTLRSRGNKMGIVTGKSRGAWEITLRHVSLVPFDTMVVDDDVSEPKPDSEGIEKAMADLQATPSETIYVGDSLSDLEAAKGAGVDFFAALWSKNEAETRSFEQAAAEIGPFICAGHPGEVELYL